MTSYYQDDPTAFDPSNIRRKNGQIRKEPTTRPAGLSDLGVLKGFGDLQPDLKGYTAPTATPGPTGLDQGAGAREMRLAQMGYDPKTGVARPADALLSGMFKAPDTAGMFVRPGFEDDPNFQMAAVPSGMAALRGQEAGVLAGPVRQHQFLDFPFNLSHGAERHRPEELTVPPTVPPTDTHTRSVPDAVSVSQKAALAKGIPLSAIKAYHDQGRLFDPVTGAFAAAAPGWGLDGIDPTTMAEAETIPVGWGTPRDPSAEELFDRETGVQRGYEDLQPGVSAVASPPTDIKASSNDLTDEEFELAWLRIQYQGTLDPNAIRSVIDPETNQPLGLTPQSEVLIEAFRDKEARKTATRDFEEKKARADEQFRLQSEEWEATQKKIIADEARLARQEDLGRLQLGLAERVWNPVLGEWEYSPPPSTLAERQLGQQRTEAQRAETFRRAQLAEQVAGREAQTEQVRLAREQESDLARLAMGMRGEPTFDELEGMLVPGAIPSTLGQRQLEEQTTAREQEQELARLAMGLGPTGPMDPAQTFEAQQLELQRALAGLAGEGGGTPQTLAQRQSDEAEAIRRIQLGIPLGNLEKVLPDDFKTRAEIEAGLERTSREQQASMQRDLERTMAEGARGLTERGQDIERRLAEISLGLDTEGQQALPAQQLREDIRATQRGEALQQAALQGRIGEDETVAGRAQTEAERAAPIREALERAQLLGTLDGAETLEAQLARAGLTGMLGEDPTLARRQLEQQGETASLNALVNVFQSAMQNPYAFSAMRTMAGGGAPFANLLAPLGFAMPGQAGQGAGQFFSGGTPTMAQFAEADPEGLNYLQALLGFSGVSPAQLAQQSAGITPGVRALLPPGMGAFRGRSLR